MTGPQILMPWMNARHMEANCHMAITSQKLSSKYVREHEQSSCISKQSVCSSSSSCILIWLNKRGTNVTAKDLSDRMLKIQVKINIDGNDNDSEKRDHDISESTAEQFDTLIRRGKYFKCDAMDSCLGKDIMQIIMNEMASFESDSNVQGQYKYHTMHL
ncbi:Aspartyl/glutamyl-tRNA(Asn/Gln) amidotransferase subunit [Trichinella spiralis]|uniref:Aspartyl/glutamyl-tRNA(Asn/Gln) amidotransferase subunit n=1 Tax=Trichinella spiralis TaxID=6334 RepID=A0ABR3KAK8_TRISP